MPLPLQVLIAVQVLPMTFCARKYREKWQQKVSVTGYVVCGQLQGEPTAARSAKTCCQEGLDSWDRIIENVPVTYIFKIF